MSAKSFLVKYWLLNAYLFWVVFFNNDFNWPLPVLFNRFSEDMSSLSKGFIGADPGWAPNNLAVVLIRPFKNPVGLVIMYELRLSIENSESLGLNRLTFKFTEGTTSSLTLSATLYAVNSANWRIPIWTSGVFGPIILPISVLLKS